VAFGLSVTVDSLQEYIQKILQNLQQEIKGKCKTIPRCNVNCNRKFEPNSLQWCQTCHVWKLELEKHKRNANQNTFWKKINSIDFSQSLEEISKVYVKDLYCLPGGALRDLRSILSLFRNCDSFCIDNQLVGCIHETRNRYFAHNYDLKIHTVDKSRCITFLIKLLQAAAISTTKSAQRALPKLSNLLITESITAEIAQNAKDTLAIQMHVKHMDNHEEAKRELEQVYVRMLHENRKKKPLGLCLRNFLGFSLYLMLIGSILYGMNTKSNDVIPTISGNGHFDLINIGLLLIGISQLNMMSSPRKPRRTSH
jgi:hypothetical protein